MSLKIYSFIALISLTLTGAAQAQVGMPYFGPTYNIIVLEETGQFQLPGGGNLSNASTYSFGKFDLDSYQGESDYGSITRYFQFFADPHPITQGNLTLLGEPLTGGQALDQIHALIYDPLNDAIGIFSSTNILWEIPYNFGMVTLSNVLIDEAVLGDADTLTLVEAGMQGFDEIQLQPVANTLFSVADVGGVSAIPEPSEVGLWLGLFTVGLIYFKRRQSAERS